MERRGPGRGRGCPPQAAGSASDGGIDHSTRARLTCQPAPSRCHLQARFDAIVAGDVEPTAADEAAAAAAAGTASGASPSPAAPVPRSGAGASPADAKRAKLGELEALVASLEADGVAPGRLSPLRERLAALRREVDRDAAPAAARPAAPAPVAPAAPAAPSSPLGAGLPESPWDALAKMVSRRSEESKAAAARQVLHRSPETARSLFLCMYLSPGSLLRPPYRCSPHLRPSPTPLCPPHHHGLLG